MEGLDAVSAKHARILVLLLLLGKIFVATRNHLLISRFWSDELSSSSKTSTVMLRITNCCERNTLENGGLPCSDHGCKCFSSRRSRFSLERKTHLMELSFPYCCIQLLFVLLHHAYLPPLMSHFSRELLCI